MSTGEISSGNSILRELLSFRDNDNYSFEQISIYNEATGKYTATDRNFYRGKLEIYDVTRIITQIVEQVGLQYNVPLSVLPHKSVDTIGKDTEKKNYITYQIDTIKPALINDTDRREVKPRYRYTLRFTNSETSNIVSVYGQLIDHYIRFRIYGRTETETEQLMVMFRHLMEVYASIIMDRGGVDRFRFEVGGTLSSEHIGTDQRQDVMFLDYLVRTEDLYTLDEPIIKLIEIVLTRPNGGT